MLGEIRAIPFELLETLVTNIYRAPHDLPYDQHVRVHGMAD